MNPVPKELENEYHVIRDTREKPGHGWSFSAPFKGTLVKKLDTGDYSIEGFEDIVVVERKGCLLEFVVNIINDRDRFERELCRMIAFKVAVVVLEFTMDDIMAWPVGSGVPEEKWDRIQTRPPLIVKTLCELMIGYPEVQFVLAGKYGREFTASLLKRVLEKYGKRRKIRNAS